MKLSFSIPSKSKSKSKPSQTQQHDDQTKPQFLSQFGSSNNNNESKSKQYLTEFDSSTLATGSATHNNPIQIIPPIENEWRPFKRMKNLDLPLESASSAAAEIGFEIETLDSNAAAADDKIGYGLNLRENGGDEGSEAAEIKPKTEDLLLDKLRSDLKRLPEGKGFEDFDDMPVEGFGAALLAGYGWYEGRGIGRNAKEDVKVKEYTRRTAKEGLGFFSNDAMISSNDDKRNVSSGRSEKNGKLKEKSRDREGDGFFIGKDVRVIGGKSDIVGLKGMIVERLDHDWVVLKLARSEEEVKVRVFDIAKLGSKEEERCLRKLKELRVGQGRKSGGKDNEKRSSDRRESGNRDGGGSETRADLERGIGWLRKRIRVRIISKELRGGRLYLKKGEVVDVAGPYKCDISMDESRELVQGVDQDFLETALPRRGGPVLVLYGKHKGVYGNLVQRDLDTEIGVVQDSDTHELVNVKLEQVAEYMGDPSYLSY